VHFLIHNTPKEFFLFFFLEVIETDVKFDQVFKIRSKHLFIYFFSYILICFQSELSSTIHFVIIKSKV